MTIFQEQQRFSYWWLYLILFSLSGLMIYTLYGQLVLNEPFGSNPASDTGLILTAILVFILNILFFIVRLDTRIDEKAIHMHYFPFIKKEISWDDIEEAEVLNYGFVGGWGIRIWTKYGTVYNTKGKMGLALRLKNGKKLLIGTQEPERMKQVLLNANLISDKDSQ